MLTVIVYAFRRPHQRVTSWAVATGDRPEDVRQVCGSREQALRAAHRWASKLFGWDKGRVDVVANADGYALNRRS